MRLLALFLAGTATFASAAAQDDRAYSDFLPMENRMPAALFAPNSLAGTMLQPLASPVSASEAPNADIMPPPEPAIVPAAISPEEDPTPTMTASVPATEGEAFAEPEANLPPSSLAADMAAADLPQELPTEPSMAEEGAGEPAEALPAPGVTAAVAAVPPVEEEPAPEASLAPTSGKITVIVENVESASGSVNVAICDKSLSREGCPFVREVPASLGFVETEFDDIPPGTYAVVGYHDVNGNNSFDKLLGMPREPYALSNHAGEKLIPTFSDASLKITPGDNAIIIRLQRLGG